MPKNILIFSDGTGQFGGLRPDQHLSNVYKMYRAMRPGPDSPILPSEQVAFYDPGLGAGETGGTFWLRAQRVMESAVGSGIDDNVIDCYEAIISHYEPGDQICLIGFSRGAYTARSVANVLNLCGVPTQMSDGSPVPRHGDKLRKIASDAVKYVYNHGAGFSKATYEDEREEKARRFRLKYGSNAEGEKAKEQGNVQPTFIGVFDTVAALDNKKVNFIVGILGVLFMIGLVVSVVLDWPWYWIGGLGVLASFFGYRWLKLRMEQFKYFSPSADRPLRFKNPRDWYAIWKNGHRAVWSRKHYDRYLDSDLQFARHALAIDENRADFDRVSWATKKELAKTEGRKPEWLKQVWFPGCHSDIGGSYPEPESRLSDIALQWMLDELKECVPDIQIRQELVVTAPDPKSLQHEERFVFKAGPLKLRWKPGARKIVDKSLLHPSVIERLEADSVPQMESVMPYRPAGLASHKLTKEYFVD